MSSWSCVKLSQKLQNLQLHYARMWPAANSQTAYCFSGLSHLADFDLHGDPSWPPARERDNLLHFLICFWHFIPIISFLVHTQGIISAHQTPLAFPVNIEIFSASRHVTETCQATIYILSTDVDAMNLKEKILLYNHGNCGCICRIVSVEQSTSWKLYALGVMLAYTWGDFVSEGERWILWISHRLEEYFPFWYSMLTLKRIILSKVLKKGFCTSNCEGSRGIFHSHITCDVTSSAGPPECSATK